VTTSLIAGFASSMALIVAIGSQNAFVLRQGLRPAQLTAAGTARATLGATLLTCLAFTYLNPHVYLDTVLLLGGLANQQPARWAFAAGAMVGSAVWFTGLGVGARQLAPLLARPVTWRVLDGLIAVTMAALAVRLLLA
jgi:L-lysine exporter family protein LysE/ArgO